MSRVERVFIVGKIPLRGGAAPGRGPAAAPRDHLFRLVRAESAGSPARQSLREP
jgi:hypothetical protein